MGLQFVPTSPSGQAATLDFLRDVFHSDLGMNSLRPEVFHWKYFSDHPDWTGPRSYVLERAQGIVAHGGIWPLRLAARAGELKMIHLIDWAAVRAAPGAGIHLLKSVAAMADVMITIGGSPDTKKILPKIGYQNGGIFKRYVLAVRPWLQFRTRPQYNWKTPLRFLQNAVSGFKPVGRIPPHWQISRVTRFESSVQPMLAEQTQPSSLRSLRTIARLTHMLTCPAAEVSGFVVAESGRPLGYFVIAKLGRQVRLLDFQISKASESARHGSDWCSLFAAITRTVCEDSQVAELVLGTSSEKIGGVLQTLGFRLRRQDEILYYDPRKWLEPGTQLDLNLIDSDLSFLYNPARPYIS